jgi:hypothetical protein
VTRLLWVASGSILAVVMFPRTATLVGVLVAWSLILVAELWRTWWTG